MNDSYTQIHGPIEHCSELITGEWFAIKFPILPDASDYNDTVSALYMMRPVDGIELYFMVAYYNDGLVLIL